MAKNKDDLISAIKLAKKIKNAFFILGGGSNILVSNKGYQGLVINFQFSIFNFLVKPFINHTLKKAKKIIVSNPNLIKSSPYLRKFQQKCEVIPFGVDLSKFEKFNEKEVENLKKKYNNFVLCSIGRLHPQKDFSTILKALKLIVSEVKNLKLLIVGDGPLRESLEKESEDLNSKQYVKFLGPRKDIPILINLSDIIILSTNWEGLPLVPLEAGACKKPVIASDVDGVKETIINDGTGLLFKLGSAKDLADKIFKLYKDENLRKEMGERGFGFVSENFSKERMIKEYQDLYESFL